MAKVTNHFQRTKLITLSTDKHYSIHLTLKITSAQVVETSVTNNSSSQNHPHPDDHTIRTIAGLYSNFVTYEPVILVSRKGHEKFQEKHSLD